MPGEDLPSPVLVTVGTACGDCKAGVQQQDALFGPGCQVTAGGHLTVQIAAHLFEDVQQRRLNAAARVDAEGEAIGRPRRMVGVLSDDTHFHFVRMCQRQGAKDLVLGRADADSLVSECLCFGVKLVSCLHDRFLHDLTPFHE